MPLEFTMDSAARLRLAQTGFDLTSLPHEYCYACDLCSWQVFRTISHIDRYGFASTYQMCEGCGLVFQNPRPTAEGYAELYAKWYRPLVAALQGRHQDKQALLADQRAYAAKLVRFLKQNMESRPIRTSVDLGGSTGCIAKAVQDALGGKCLVVDPSPLELGEARKLGLECEQTLAEQWNPDGRRFDLALICRSVDHLLSISGVLTKVAQSLKSGGHLFIDPVDFDSWARTMLDYRKLLKIDHVYYLSDETMRLYLRAFGFEVVASDFGDGTHIRFLARYTGEIQKPTHLTSYARETGQMLRERLVKPVPPPYPTDALTRVARRVRQLLKGG
ncbi:MAG: methyltransferase domain-containing protein [Nitrospiraceae bacterium]